MSSPTEDESGETSLERPLLVRLDDMIMVIDEALSSLSVEDPDRLELLDDLTFVLRSRFDIINSAEDIDRAITTAEAAVALTENSATADRASRLHALSVTMFTRYQQNSSIDDLNKAIITGDQALELMSNDHPDKITPLMIMAVALHGRAELTRAISDINRSIAMNEEALSYMSTDDPDRIAALNNLCNSLQFRVEMAESIGDLNDAIAKGEQAVELMLQNNDDRGGALFTTLNIALQMRFDLTESVDDINRGVAYAERALMLTSKNDIHYAGRLANLSGSLKQRFERTGSLNDLKRAIDAIEESVKVMTDDCPNRAVIFNNSGNALYHQFQTMGGLETLDKCIVAREQAIRLTPAIHYNYPLWLGNLGSSLQLRFDWTGCTEDLNRAITLINQALTSIPKQHQEYRRQLNSLSIALRDRFERNGIHSDIDEAIASSEEAVKFTSPNHPDFGVHLGNLSAAIFSRFEKSSSLNDLDRSIENSEMALSVFPKDHPNRAVELCRLGHALAQSFKNTGTKADLDRSIVCLEEGLKFTPQGHPSRTARLLRLGLALQARFKLTKSPGDRDQSIAVFKDGLAMVTAPPSDRITAAWFASCLLAEDDAMLAKPFLRAAIELMPIITPRTLKQSDKQYGIARFAGIPSQAASLYLECEEQPYNALQLLELGRGVLASLQLEIRSDVSSLRLSHPVLAKQFDDIRLQLDTQMNSAQQSNIDHRHAVSRQLESLLGQVRGLDGFERFLLGPSEREMMDLAQDGAIVVFNVSHIRSDAFLVQKHSISSLRLPLLKYSTLEAHSKLFLETMHSIRSRNYDEVRKKLNKVLEWLWDVAAEPVLNALGFITNVSQDIPSAWPRVWWVGSGLLNIMPIHAAGYHEAVPPRTTMDRVVSSYLPTIKSLAHARERQTRTTGLQRQKIMLIAMANTPGQRDLPFAEKEVDNLKTLLPSTIEISVKKGPTKQEVLSSLRSYQIVHFSCHGVSSPNDPSQSTLMLTDWETMPLTVSDLTALNIPSSQLAFLSACHTANSRDLDLLDESINLTSAVLLAGYPSVVGTLWRIHDSHASEIATDLYLKLLCGTRLETQRSAHGLHEATRLLRDRTRRVPGFSKIFPHDPLVWAPYIHLGI